MLRRKGACKVMYSKKGGFRWHGQQGRGLAMKQERGLPTKSTNGASNEIKKLPMMMGRKGAYDAECHVGVVDAVPG